MNNMKLAAELVQSGEITFIDYAAECAAEARDLSAESALPNELAYWKMVRSAQENGKKLVFVSGPVPAELLYAMDCVPLYLDLLVPRLSYNTKLTTWLTGETDKRVNPSLCHLNKVELGMLLVGQMGVVPDAYVSVPIPCDSARAAYQAIERYVKAPVFNFDIPLHKGGNSQEYIRVQLFAFIEFLENLTDSPLSKKRFFERVALGDTAAQLINACAEIRKNKPCPASAHMNVLNELNSAFGPTQEMIALLERELALCQGRVDAGLSPCAGGEKHRVLLLHNMLWQGIELSAWLEKTYGAVTVMDGYSFKRPERFTQPESFESCVDVLCRRMMSGTSVHGAGASGGELAEMVSTVIREYEADVSIFMGNAGCRHQWAAAKIITDKLEETFHMSTLILDMDNTDRNYRSDDDLKAAISEYMDAVVNGR